MEAITTLSILVGIETFFVLIYFMVTSKVVKAQQEINQAILEDTVNIKMVITNNNGFTETEKEQLNS